MYLLHCQLNMSKYLEFHLIIMKLGDNESLVMDAFSMCGTSVLASLDEARYDDINQAQKKDGGLTQRGEREPFLGTFSKDQPLCLRIGMDILVITAKNN